LDSSSKKFFFPSFSLSPFLGVRENREETPLHCKKEKKKKRKENKNKTMKTVMLCPTAHLCFSRNLFLVGGLRVHHSSHVESFLFYIFWSNQNFIFEKTENRKMKQNRGGAGGVKLAEEVGSKKKRGFAFFLFCFSPPFVFE